VNNKAYLMEDNIFFTCSLKNLKKFKVTPNKIAKGSFTVENGKRVLKRVKLII